MNNSPKKEAGKSRGFRLGAALVILLALALILVASNWGKILAPLKDAALETDSGTFPVELPGSAGYGLYEFGENICLLTDTYIYTYNSSGANIAGIQHGLQNPAASSNAKRVMVYDRSGKGIKVFSRTAEVYSAAADDTIVFGQIGTNERCAYVTTSARYSNCLYVLNGEGKQIFRYYSPDKKIMQVCFTDDETGVFLTLMDERDGELIFSAARLDINASTESFLWETQLAAGVTYSAQLCGDGLYIVGADGHALLDPLTGDVKASGGFAGSVADIPRADKLRVLVFNDSASNAFAAVAYNELLEAQYTLGIESASAYAVSANALYVLSGNTLRAYDDKLELTKEYVLDDVYSDMMIEGGSAYLLGYNTVQKQVL